MRIPLWVLQTVASKKVPFTADFATLGGNVIRVRMLKVEDAEGGPTTVCDFEWNPENHPSVPNLLKDLETQVEQLEASADCSMCFGGRFVDSMFGPTPCPKCVKDD